MSVRIVIIDEGIQTRSYYSMLLQISNGNNTFNGFICLQIL